MKSRNPSGWRCLAFAVAVVIAGGLLRAQDAKTPGAREIVDRFIRQAGGEAAFKAIKSIRAKGTLSITQQNMTGEIESILARPAKQITRANVKGIGNLEEGYDGKVGWTIDPVNGPSLVTGKQLIERADSAWFDAAMLTPDYVSNMTVAGRETYDKRPAYRLKIALKSGTTQDQLYDVETGFCIGQEATRETPFGSAPTITIYREYKKFGSVMMPSVHIERILGIEQIVTFTSYEFNTVPANAFALPAVIKALIK